MSTNESTIKSDNVIEERDYFLEIQKLVKRFGGENFELGDYIGKGGESLVYTIKSKKAKNQLAFKYIIPNKKHKKHTKINEIDISSKLKNPNIIQVYYYFKSPEDNSEFIIMENADFGNLYQYKNKLNLKIFSESLSNYFAQQILKALIYCHNNKIAHLDLKPENIVVNIYSDIKLIDFSLSMNYRGKNLNNKIKLYIGGTPLYMPLEVMEHRTIKYKDLNKIDSYSFGVILFYLSFGYYPYNLSHEDVDDYEIMEHKMSQKLEIDNSTHKFSNYYIDFLSKLLDNDINKRMSLYESMEHPWIKIGQVLNDERENISNKTNFITCLISDGVVKFNTFLKNNGQ